MYAIRESRHYLNKFSLVCGLWRRFSLELLDRNHCIVHISKESFWELSAVTGTKYTPTFNDKAATCCPVQPVVEAAPFREPATRVRACVHPLPLASCRDASRHQASVQSQEDQTLLRWRDDDDDDARAVPAPIYRPSGGPPTPGAGLHTRRGRVDGSSRVT